MFVVLSVGEDGMWEGKTGDKEGWFPPDNVSEQQKRHTIGESLCRLSAQTPNHT